jgi:hypothetical protein
MRLVSAVLVGSLLALTFTSGCGHVGRKVDLVSKFGLSETAKIVIEFCDVFDGVPKLLVSDSAAVATILEDMRQAVGVPRYRWGTIAGANFVLKSGEKRELEVFRRYVNGNLRLVVRDGRRFWGFGGKLAELIQTHAKPYRE